ncbi:MAG TPA: universal stress protein [Nitrososphaeraceae archaeon]
MPIGKILVAVDGSNASLKASTYAIDLAKTYDAELIILNIVSVTPYSQFEYANIGRMKDIESEEEDRAKQDLDKVKQKATEKKVSVKTDVVVKYTSIVKEIVEYAENKKVDMVVIGSRGMTGFKKLLLGSIASGVVTYSHCPVLVVK